MPIFIFSCNEPLGMNLHPESCRVESLVSRGQAEKLGVRSGMMLAQIQFNDTVYRVTRAAEVADLVRRKPSASCAITFVEGGNGPAQQPPTSQKNTTPEITNGVALLVGWVAIKMLAGQQINDLACAAVSASICFIVSVNKNYARLCFFTFGSPFVSVIHRV